MAGDLKVRYDSDLRAGDFLFSDNDLELDDGLETAVWISLFTDRRAAPDDELPDPNSTNKRGWWGDKVSPDIEGDEIGSKLWLLERSKTTDETLIDAERHVQDCLQWMLDDLVAKEINVTTERMQLNDGTETIGIQVEILKVDGSENTFQFNKEWENT